MRYELFSRVALAVNVPDHRLKKGDVATIVEYFPPSPDREAGYALEVFNILGQTVDVLSLRESQLDELRADEIANVRTLAEAA